MLVFTTHTACRFFRTITVSIKWTRRGNLYPHSAEERREALAVDVFRRTLASELVDVIGCSRWKNRSTKYHRRSQDFVCMGWTDVLKIDSCSACGYTWCAGGALTNFPCKLRLIFFHRPGGCRCTHCTPGYACATTVFVEMFRANSW